MSKWIFPFSLFFVFSLILSSHQGYSQVRESRSERIMFYNVENFFDTYDDSLTDDNDFLPDGLMRWNFSRYTKKLNSLCKTIIAAGEWDPPSIVAFCEIENRKVLEDLIFNTYFSKFDWGIIHEDSPDRRGIDVCLIFRKQLINIITYSYWIPREPDNIKFDSRSILYVKAVMRSDTIHFIVNHWPSRRGGVLAGEDNRQLIAKMIGVKGDSIFKASHGMAKIVILGDFNCTPDDQIMKSFKLSVNSGKFILNLSDSVMHQGLGTYRYQGRWEMIDQVLVSQPLLTSIAGLYTEQDLFKIYRPDFLMMKDPKYPGMTPFSTYRGYKYQGGFSDHLPVILQLKVK